MQLKSQMPAGRPVSCAVGIVCVVLGLVACGGGSGNGASQTVTPETHQITTSVATGLPEVAAKSITKVMTSQGTATPGSAIVAPGSAGSEAFVVAVDANDEPILLGLFSGGANLSVDSTAQTLVRIALNAVEPPAGFTGASINAAITASTNYASLLTAIQAQLAIGQSPSTSSSVMEEVWQVAADVATSIGLVTASATNVRHPLAAANATALPYYFWKSGATDKAWLIDVESTPNFNFLNRSFLAWEVSTDKGFKTIADPLSTGRPLQVFGYYGGSESTTKIVGVAATERLTITVQQSDATRKQNSLNLTNSIIFDGLTLALKGLGISPTDTAKCVANFSKTILASSEYTALVVNPNKSTLAAYGSTIRDALIVNNLVGCQFGFKASDSIIAVLKIVIKSEWAILTNLVESLSPAQALMKMTTIAAQLIDSNNKSYSVMVCKANNIYSLCGLTKISASGQDLPDNAFDWSCIRQNSTGLFWEAHVRRGWDSLDFQLRHQCSWDPTQKCQGYSNLGNGDIWDAQSVTGTVCGRPARLPTVDEGSALVSDPAYLEVNTTPGAAMKFWFGVDDMARWGWTSSIRNEFDAWNIGFDLDPSAVFLTNRKSIDGSVRLVAGP